MANGYFAIPGIYRPAMRLIAAITNNNPASVTTTDPHGYIDGTIVRLDVPPNFGMFQVNQQFGTIVVTSPTTFTINIDTTHYDAFVVPSAFTSPPYSAFYAQCVPIGEDNAILRAALVNILNPNQ